MLRSKLFATAALLLSAALAAPAQSLPASPSCPFCGVWRATFDGLPGVSLVVTDESGSLAGAVLFYLHVRKTPNDPYTATPGLPEPIFHLRVEGNTLMFQASHRRAHPPRAVPDPPMAFSLTLMGADAAQFTNQTEHGPTVTMTRSDY
jgi:hypothetical protein